MNIKRLGLGFSALALAVSGVVVPRSAFAEDGDPCKDYADGECVTVKNTDELSAAISGEKKAIVVGQNFELTADLRTAVDTDLYLQNYTITTEDCSIINNKGTLTVYGEENGKFEVTNSVYAPIYGYGKVVLRGGTLSALNYGVVMTGGSFEMYGGKITVVGTSDDDDTYGVTIFEDGKFIMNGGEVESKHGFAVTGYGKDTGAEFEINQGTLISGDDYAIYQPQIDGKTSINGGIITGGAGAISVNRGEVVVNGGILTSEGTAKVSGDVAADGTNGYDNAVIGISKEYGPVTVKISNGDFIAKNDAAMIADPSGLDNSNPATVEITGGKFSTEPADGQVAKGYEVYLKDGMYNVVPAAEVKFPETIYLAVGESYDLSEDMNDTAKEYATFNTSDIADIASVDGLIITGKNVGSGVLGYGLYRHGGSVQVVVYGVAEDEEIEEDDQEVVADAANDVIAAIVSGKTDIAGFEFASEIDADKVKAALADNDTEIKTTVDASELYTDDVDKDVEEAIDDKIAEFFSLDDDPGFMVNLAGYYEIDVLLVAAKGDTETTLGYLTEFDDTVTVTVALPEYIEEVAEGYERVYYVVRYHSNDDVEVLMATDNGDGTISFDSDKFSVYGLAYVDVEAKDDEDAGATTPDTGRVTAAQSAASGAAVVTTIAAALVLAGALVFAKQNR